MSKTYKKFEINIDEKDPSPKKDISEKRKKRNLKKDWELFGDEPEDHEEFFR
jgi:hypothetical protein